MESNALKDKVIVVTGGAGAIGQNFVLGIAKRGGVAVAADVNIEAAEKVAKNYLGSAGRVEAVCLDITSEDSVSSLLTDLYRRYGRVDALVNNAYPRNKNYGRKLEDVTYADFCENLNLHLGGYFLVAQQFCMRFKKQGFGNLVNMSSIYGAIAPRFEVYDGTTMTMPVEYAAIKSAIVHLTRYFAQYFKGSGIRVNCLSPGGILANQPQSFLTRYNESCSSKGMLFPQDILGALIFLLSDDSTYLTGQNLIVDDGFSL